HSTGVIDRRRGVMGGGYAGVSMSRGKCAKVRAVRLLFQSRVIWLVRQAESLSSAACAQNERFAAD
ncbi:hypothetical protein Tco_1532435, partial [Tanacetum coccineum]